MITWAVMVILIVLGIIAIRMNHLKHRIFIIILISAALFLYLTMTYVNTKNELDFTNSEGVLKAVGVYTGWLANGFENLKSVTGYAIKMDWTSTNKTFLKNIEKDLKT